MIGAIILGLVAGFIAKLLVPGRDPGGFFVTIAIGLAGALVGYFIFTKALGIGDDDIFDLGGLLGAIVGSVIVLLGYRKLIGTGDGRARTV
ncbi:MAG: GlsB/YeaQ/YmgE family stress response membrane protein [Solirubrobacteraceae bacterium]